MQTVKCFEAKLDEYGEYKIKGIVFPGNRSPDPYLESNKGTLYKHHSKIEGDVTYVIYALGEPTQVKTALVEQAWNKYCA